MKRLALVLCVTFVCLSAARAESQSNTSDTLYSLGTRVFDFGHPSSILDMQEELDFVSLTNVPWIRDMTWSDPLLAATVIHIKDNTSLYALGEPGWLPDLRSLFHSDPTLPSIFDLEGYEVGWFGQAREARSRGDILIFPRNDPQSFHVLCAYDRSEPQPTFCSVNFRYWADPNLRIRIRIYQVTSPLNDFAEIVARVDALVRCLDVTEVVQPVRRASQIRRCRTSPSLLRRSN